MAVWGLSSAPPPRCWQLLSCWHELASEGLIGFSGSSFYLVSFPERAGGEPQPWDHFHLLNRLVLFTEIAALHICFVPIQVQTNWNIYPIEKGWCLSQVQNMFEWTFTIDTAVVNTVHYFEIGFIWKAMSLSTDYVRKNVQWVGHKATNLPSTWSIAHCMATHWINQ